MSNVFCIGELLIDMVCIDNKGLKYGQTFEKKAGGAPANVAVAISKLGGNAYFLGKVGKDFFGDYLIELLKELKVNTDLTSRGGNTTTAFVGIDKNGERNFTFLRGSDMEYKFNNINTELINNTDIIHFGSATGLLGGDLKKTYFELLDYAIKNNIYICFDPNYRDNLINSECLEEYIKDCKIFLKNSDFVKVSLEELNLITSEKDYELGIRKLHDMGAKAIAVTLGEKGTLLSINGFNKIIKSIKINQVDSTGAGDAFVGAVLSELSKIDKKNEISFKKWEEIIEFANKVGAITCTNYGAITSIPTIEQVNDYVSDNEI